MSLKRIKHEADDGESQGSAQMGRIKIPTNPPNRFPQIGFDSLRIQEQRLIV